MTNRNVYLENGYNSRDNYLQSLADDLGIPLEAVLSLAEVLGPDEDFDGLVSSLEDAADGGWFDEEDCNEDDLIDE